MIYMIYMIYIYDIYQCENKFQTKMQITQQHKLSKYCSKFPSQTLIHSQCLYCQL